MKYEDFILEKSKLAHSYGFEPLWIPDYLFDFQKVIVDWSVRTGRAAVLADCGLGKSIMALVWAKNMIRKTNKPGLVLTPLTVSRQFVNEGEKFGIKLNDARSGRIRKGINVVNYERLHHFNPNEFGWVVGDESSILKNFGGKRRIQITKFMQRINHRLLCSATPAPNDFIELGTSSEALDVMSRNQMLGMFFSHEGNSTQGWELKGHARRAFWRWVASWARAIRKPSDFGFDDGDFVLPPLKVTKHITPGNFRKQVSGRFFNFATGLAEQRTEKKATVKERCEKVADLIPSGESSVVWCHHNAEGDLLEKLIPDSKQIAGRHSDEDKEAMLLAFEDGSLKTLITKPKIAGFGMNWQHCSNVFCFVSHCYDEKTEVLTKHGWRTFGEVRIGEEVATVNQDDLEFEWQQCENVIWDDYTGDMIQFSGMKNFDLLVTPNHNMFVQRCPVRHPSDGGDWELKKAHKIADRFRRQEYRMRSCPNGYSGERLEYIDIPIPSDLRISSRSRIVSRIPIDVMTQLAGWYLSEGHARPIDSHHAGQIVISQTEVNHENREEIIYMLKSLGLNVYHKTKDIRVCSKQLASFLHEHFGHLSRNKRIPTWMKNLDYNLLVLLRDTMIKGDGCHNDGIPRFYRTFSRQLADDFQEICLKTGIRATVQTREYDGYLFYDVSIAWQNTSPSIHMEPEYVSYSGKIGCVTVPNHTLIVRRNGIPVISGNSFEQYYQMVRRCWRFGQENPVKVRIVATEAEQDIMTNMLRKERQAVEMFEGIVREMRDFQVKEKRVNDRQVEMEVPAWL